MSSHFVTIIKMMFSLLCLVSIPAIGQPRKPAPRSETFRVVGYFNEDAAKAGRYRVKDIETSGAANLLTHIDYAFGRVVNDRCEIPNRAVALDQSYDARTSVDGTADPVGDNLLRGTFHQLQQLKRLHPKLKIIISLGGWGQSAGFSSAVSAGTRRDFVKSCVDLFIRGNFAPGITAPGIFDGIDIDWEYPVSGGVEPGRAEDKANFTAVALEFRRQLKTLKPGLLLTAALPAEGEYFANFELNKIARSMDFISIMAYDLHWNSEPLTAFHSALCADPRDATGPALRNRNGDFALRGFLKAGVPAAKLVFGVPFYGKGWAGVEDVNHGLYQHATGEATVSGSYRELQQLPESADRYYDPVAVSCSVWNDHIFWSYDCPQSLRRKIKYLRAHHVGGVMFWELSQDTPDGDLIHILASGT